MSRKITTLIVHCTASPDNMDIGAKEITDWHQQRGWSTIGYHWVVRRDGTIEPGRPEETMGAHVKGHNSDSLGIVWVGTNKIEDIQMDALKTKVKELCYRYKLEAKDVLGHYELYSGKTCPNLKMNKFRDSLFSDKEVDKKEYLPEETSEEDINVTLEDIEKDILDW